MIKTLWCYSKKGKCLVLDESGKKLISGVHILENCHGLVSDACLIAQGYSQMEGVDYDETFALVAHMESIWILLALVCHLKFKLYQMDVKTAFLNGFLREDIYVAQPKEFIGPHFPDHVLYLKKALYGLKQAPRASYDQLTQYLMSHGFTRGKIYQTLFIKREGGELIVAQVYVDDIIFGSTKDELAHSFSKLMQAKFERSMIGELNHFLELLQTCVIFSVYMNILIV